MAPRRQEIVSFPPDGKAAISIQFHLEHNGYTKKNNQSYINKGSEMIYENLIDTINKKN